MPKRPEPIPPLPTSGSGSGRPYVRPPAVSSQWIAPIGSTTSSGVSRGGGREVIPLSRPVSRPTIAQIGVGVHHECGCKNSTSCDANSPTQAMKRQFVSQPLPPRGESGSTFETHSPGPPSAILTRWIQTAMTGAFKFEIDVSTGTPSISITLPPGVALLMSDLESAFEKLKKDCNDLCSGTGICTPECVGACGGSGQCILPSGEAHTDSGKPPYYNARCKGPTPASWCGNPKESEGCKSEIAKCKNKCRLSCDSVFDFKKLKVKLI
ncbi:MAG: hypothetical protein HUU55_22430 [Myxococcales bacterium]|nr:hypothetical protein [Myxococcales bacterium]